MNFGLYNFLFEAIEDLQRERFNNLLPKPDDNEKKKRKAEEFQNKLGMEGIDSFDELEKVINQTDPTRNGVYKRWLYDKWFSDGFKTEDSDKVKGYLKTYDANRKKLPKEYSDIGKIESSGRLFSILKDNGLIGLETSAINPVEISDLEKSGDIEKIGENEEWVGFIPKTTKGSCVLGKNTEWCTAKYAETDKRNMFNYYNGEGPIYIFIRKTAGKPSKVQIHIDSDQIMDENDVPTKIPAGLLDLMKNSGKDSVRSAYKYIVSKDPNAPPEALIELANDQDKNVRNLVLKNPNVPPEALMILANDENERVRENVARNTNATPKILRILSNDQSRSIRENVARNPNAPPEVLTKLANDEDINVRYSVARNPNAPSEALRFIVNNSLDSYGAELIAKNPNTPPDILIKFANDQNALIRQSVAKNTNLPLDLIKILANDLNSFVRNNIAENPNTPPDILIKFANDPNESIRYSVAKSQNTPPEVLIILANLENNVIRRNVAGNPNTPAEALIELANDPIDIVRQNIARNPNAPPEALTMLANDPNENIRHTAERNPNFPKQSLQEKYFDINRWKKLAKLNSKLKDKFII